MPQTRHSLRRTKCLPSTQRAPCGCLPWWSAPRRFPPISGDVSVRRDSSIGYAVWPLDQTAIIIEGAAAVNALGFKVTERSPEAWSATFEGFHEYKKRVATLECQVAAENWDGKPVLVARYREMPA